ncbi:sulfotransferase family protein [Prochlorococcus marinus]|uniref:sulfotransferase family protein n=1 Tax=Prochlorococcus marinus TaxID=1219 RepID=UPI0007BBFAF7|nr:sulfotransferase domain-containing protein [Prochlorococcus marinus]KZR73246.1 Sulfotransferase domain protein [Prochlorococcus marinus str. MIT 1320]
MNNIFQMYKRKKLPHFLVLGTQKGGTTSLQKILELHSHVFLPSCKEVHYFTLHYEKPASWYSGHYQKAKWFQKRGDITPYYLFHPEAPLRIHSLLPRARLIVLLRDPVERALSQVFHARRHGFEKLGVEAALRAEEARLARGTLFSHQKHSYLARSRYLEQLDRFEELFPRRKILILRSEDLFINTETIWLQILKFLNLPIKPLTMSLPRANSGKGESGGVKLEIRDRLKNELRTTVEGVKERYGFDWGW